MKSLLVLISISITLAACEVPWPPKERWISQQLDHFTFTSSPISFWQRYLYEDKYYKPGGPILFYCGNEGSIDSFWNNTGFMFDIAPELEAFILFGEHRYYGKSLPFKNSFRQPYVQYLTVEQALADYAYMLTHLKTTLNLLDSPVIAFGGSYGGELAAYSRYLYPNIYTGALAASAPLYWTAGLGNIHGFFESATKDYKEADERCVPIIKNGFTKLMEFSKQGDYGLKEASRLLNLCKPVKNVHELQWAIKWIRNAFVMISMMDYPYKSEFMASMPANPVNVSCSNAIQYGDKDSVAGLREAAAVMYNSTKDLTCFDYQNQYIECADITGCGLGNDAYAWDFQACTQLHMYDSNKGSDKDMFPALPLTREEVDTYCRIRWGVSRNEKQLASMFGPATWKQTSNIIFSRGDRDPWGDGGLMEDASESVVVMTVVGGAHHLDLRGKNPDDPIGVTEVRKKELEMFKKWIAEKKSSEKIIRVDKLSK